MPAPRSALKSSFFSIKLFSSIFKSIYTPQKNIPGHGQAGGAGEGGAGRGVERRHLATNENLSEERWKYFEMKCDWSQETFGQ